MNAKECSDVLKDCIRNHERMHKEIVFVDDNGEHPGHLNKENDILYHAMKFALPLVEAAIPK